MGRPKTYDREDVTRKAMELFWAQGFEATSTKALAEHMGVNVPSLFAEFDSKQGLFEAAIALYRREVVTQMFGMLSTRGRFGRDHCAVRFLRGERERARRHTWMPGV